MFIEPREYVGDNNGIEEDTQCSATPCIIDESSIKLPKWIACEECGARYHLFCLGKRRTPKTFFCNSCIQRGSLEIESGATTLKLLTLVTPSLELSKRTVGSVANTGSSESDSAEYILQSIFWWIT